MRLIDADIIVTELLYDDEHEEHYTERMTIAESLDRFTEQGCPRIIRTKQIKYYDEEEQVWKIGEVIVDE